MILFHQCRLSDTYRSLREHRQLLPGSTHQSPYFYIGMQQVTSGAACIFAGPCLALPIGFFIAVHAASQYVEYQSISSGWDTELSSSLWALRVFFFFVIAMWPAVFLLPETHGPTILAVRSKRLRSEGRVNARAAHKLKRQTTRAQFQSHTERPAVETLVPTRTLSYFDFVSVGMLWREPIIEGAALWTSLAYEII